MKYHEYIKPFLPIETDNPEKDDAAEVIHYFHELKIASFDSRLEEFLNLYGALSLRKRYEDRVEGCQDTKWIVSTRDIGAIVDSCRGKNLVHGESTLEIGL